MMGTGGVYQLKGQRPEICRTRGVAGPESKEGPRGQEGQGAGLGAKGIKGSQGAGSPGPKGPPDLKCPVLGRGPNKHLSCSMDEKFISFATFVTILT